MKHWILLLAEALLTVGFPLQNVERATCASPVQRKAWCEIRLGQAKVAFTDSLKGIALLKMRKRPTSRLRNA